MDYEWWMKAIKLGNLNQLTIPRALQAKLVLTYYTVSTEKKASNWSLLMVLCFENFLHIWKRTILPLKSVHKNRMEKKSMEETQVEPECYFKQRKAKVSAWNTGKASEEGWWISSWCLRAECIKQSDGVNTSIKWPWCTLKTKLQSKATSSGVGMRVVVHWLLLA